MKESDISQAYLKNENRMLDIFFSQSTSGFFFMMLDEPITWNDKIDKEKALDYVFSHQRITRANQTMLDYYGLTMEEYLNKTPEQIYRHDLAKGRKLWRTFFDQRQMHFITQEKRKDGSMIWIEGDYVCITDEKDRILGHFGIQNDITKRIENEQIVNNDKIRFFQAQQLAKLGHWEIDLKTGTVWGSEEAHRIYGFSQDDPYLPLPVIQSAVLHTYRPMMDQALKDLIEKDLPYDVEFQIKRIGTDNILYVHSIAMVKRDESGKPLTVVGTIQDITKRKSMELEITRKANELSIHRNLLHATLQSIGDAVISTDYNGNIVSMNSVAAELTQWKTPEAKGKPFEQVFKIISETTRLECDNPVTTVLSTGKVVELENHTILIAKDGTEKYVEDCASPILDGNQNVLGVVVVFRDVTEKKSKQREIEYMSDHDFLTDLYNRRFYVQSYEKLDKPDFYPLGVMMVDVNGLKIINDAYGHDTGDYALKEVAKALNMQFEDKDIISRIGGDEFAILLPRTSEDEMYKHKTELRSNIQKISIMNVALSVAIGYEVKHEKKQSIDEMLKLAENHMYSHKFTEGVSVRNHAIKAILATLTNKYEVEKTHSERVSKICRKIGQVINLSEDDLDELEQAGLFHDIGKISIPDEILNKPSRLTESEYEIIKTHTEIGYSILRAADEYSDLAIHALYHHERWDGNGYPKGIKALEIPLFSRIIALVDAYEAMTADRPYRPKQSKAYAIEEIKRCSGTQFDPDIAKIFIELLEKNHIE